MRQELLWQNPNKLPFSEAERHLTVSRAAVDDALARWLRFAPLLRRLFPQTEASGGIIESPVTPLTRLQAERGGSGTWLLKRDDLLPVSGSIKARGGFYEVLKFAESEAMRGGLLREEDDYGILASDELRSYLARRSIAVGSTGNLGLSVGLMGAALGLGVTVHMSFDARQWKKDRLRAQGVNVVEHSGSYTEAVAEGRRRAESDPFCHFIDDESSRDLFLGYSAAGLRLPAQLAALGITVDEEHPLCVYLPCGVGGGPGGVALGIKYAFGDLAHCFFAEPVDCPSMLLGMATGRQHDISVTDIGLSGLTAADGLACPRPSAFVGREMERLLDGIFTVDDDRLLRDLAALRDAEGIALEPSALAGFSGALRCGAPAGAVHLFWATGGGMVPEEERAAYYAAGKALQS